MKVIIHESAKKFFEIIDPVLKGQEAANNLMLGLATRLAKAEEPADLPAVMMTVSNGQKLESAIVMTPPRGVVLYASADAPEEAINALVEALIVGGYPVPECNGPSAVSSLFAKIWAKRTGQEAETKTALRAYELRRVCRPDGVPGSPRQPKVNELELVARWMYDFYRAVGEDHGPGADQVKKSVERVIAAQQALLWEYQGQPASMALAVRPVRGGIAISSVYTPPENRGHGFASACVAELSQRQLDNGKEFCCLYADLDNPTSNSIYQKIGYTPAGDSIHYRFHGKTNA